MKPVHVLSPEELFCLEGCGSYEQYRHMRSQFTSGKCPFCTIDPNINTVLFTNASWTSWQNSFANKRKCTTMFVIAHTRHIRSLERISKFDWINLHKIVGEISESNILPGGILFMRFGDMRYNAGTVPHLHWNLWVPDCTGEVRIPVFKDKTKHTENQMRASEFARRYEANEI